MILPCEGAPQRGPAGRPIFAAHGASGRRDLEAQIGSPTCPPPSPTPKAADTKLPEVARAESPTGPDEPLSSDQANAPSATTIFNPKTRGARRLARPHRREDGETDGEQAPVIVTAS
jgi:hypothetical protein